MEEVLKLSYRCPGPAVKFFRWAAYQLHHQNSPYAWNLVVDLLGKNHLFDAMWDAIKSMHKERLVSLATFASVFSSYVSDNRVQEAIMTFEVMDQYGCPKDIVALNSLLSAICRDGKTVEAKQFLSVIKRIIRPDLDTYAILLEGSESEDDVGSARHTFAEMVAEVGWDPANIPAYESFLITLIKGPDGVHEALKFFDVMVERRCYPGVKFFKTALEECARTKDSRGATLATLVWEAMVCKGRVLPDTDMYNLIISMHCYLRHTGEAKDLLDEMVLNGVFPDDRTYNTLFHALLTEKKLCEASCVFSEMVKNECLPTHSNCCFAIKVFVHNGDAYMAIKVWKFMVENYKSDLSETGNFLVIELREMNRVQEAVKYAEDMIDRSIKVNSATMSKMKQSLNKAGKGPTYDELLKKWKFR